MKFTITDYRIIFIVIIILIGSQSCSQKGSDNKIKGKEKETVNLNNDLVDYLIKGKNIKFDFGEFKISSIECSTHTPQENTPASEGHHFILISLKLMVIEEGKEFSSISFILTDKKENKYIEPGAWGKIEVFGNLSDFEASKGATVFVRNPDESLNLIFEVPDNVYPNEIVLSYNKD